MISQDELEAMTKCDAVLSSEGFRCRADMFADEWADGLLGRADCELIGDRDRDRIVSASHDLDVELRSPLYGMLTGWQEQQRDDTLRLAYQGVMRMLRDANEAQKELRAADLEQRKQTYHRRHAHEYRAALDALVDARPHTLLRVLAHAAGETTQLYDAISGACPELFDWSMVDRLVEAEQRDALASM